MSEIYFDAQGNTTTDEGQAVAKVVCYSDGSRSPVQWLDIFYSPDQPRADDGKWTSGGATVGSYMLSMDKTYIRHDAQAKKGDDHKNNVSPSIPQHVQRYIQDEDKKLLAKLAGMEQEKIKYGFGTPQADKIFGEQFYLAGLEPEKIAGRANKLYDLAKSGRVMQSKYPGHSVLTGAEVKKGDQIYWSSKSGVAHVAEVDKYKPEPKK